MKIILSSVLFALVVSNILSQPALPTAPSAAVYNFSKYAHVAPNLHTGAISESIPLGAVSAGPLQQSVSLSYYFAGHRPSDLSSPVGLGFHLLAGGAITRQVLALDDFDEYGWLNTGSDVQGLVLGLLPPQYDDYVDEELDPQADVYSLQVGGLNIKFAMDHNGIIHTIPRSDLDIQLITGTYTPPMEDEPIKYFLFTDTQGNRYFFGEHYDDVSTVYTDNREETTFDDESHISAWYLYRVETHDELHAIDFTYEDHSYSYYSLQDCQIVRWKNGSSQGTVDNANCQMTAGEVEIEGKVLNSITGLASSVDFNYVIDRDDLLGSPKRLSSIDCNTGSFSKRYTFNNDQYFSDTDISFSQVNNVDELDMDFTSFSAMVKKLRLASIDISGGSETLPSYEFDYYRSDGATSGSYEAYATVNKAIDAYGFANGKFNNNNLQHIIPLSTGISHAVAISYGNGADIRDSDGDYSITTGLYKMTFPTGGTVVYDYEPNMYFNNQTSINTCCLLIANQVNCSSTSIGEDDQVINLSQAQIDNGWIDWSFDAQCTNIPAQFKIEIYDGASLLDDRVYVDINGNQDIWALNTIVGPLQANTDYTFRIEIIKGTGTAHIKYPTSGMAKEIGGVRLASRTTDDIDGVSSNNITRTFIYENDQGNSSGKIYKTPLFAFGLGNVYSDPNVLFSTASIRPFLSYEGNHMGYSMATIDHNGNGEQIQQFHTDLNIPPSTAFPPVPEQNRFFWGQHKSTITKREDNTVLQENSTIIPGEEYSQKVPSSMYTVRRLRQRRTNGNVITTDHDTKYQINTGTFRPNTSHVTQEGITKTQTIEYGSLNHLQATRISEEFINGEIYTNELTYTVDNISSPQTTSLTTRNVILPNISQYSMKIDGVNRIVNRKETSYTLWSGGHPRPFLIYRDFYDDLGSSIRETDEVKSYNSKGLVTAFRRHGYTINDVFSYDSNSSLLRSAGLGNLTRSFTYHFGSNLLSLVTEVDGTITSYNYDGLLRLDWSRDPVGAITTWDYEISKNVTSHSSKITTTSTFPADQYGFSDLTELITIKYLDGLGRTQQTVGKAQAFNGKDQIEATEYDNQGRAYKRYETYASSVSNGSFSTTFSNESFTLTTFEQSPLNRPLRVTPPVFGTVEYTYGTNTNNVSDVHDNNFGSGTLYQRTVIDGNGNKSINFRDIQGRSILDRRTNASEQSSAHHDTRYDYDWRNLVQEVVPPGSTLSNDALNFIYERDKEGKVLRKKVPSKDWVDYVYDDRDLMIGYQDGFMRIQDEPWYISRYDDFGREIASGFHLNQPTNGNIIPSSVQTTTTWGTSGTGKGKIQGETFRLLGTNDFMNKDPHYDAFGRVLWLRSNNPMGLVSNYDIIRYKYDGGSNIIETSENVRLGQSNSHETTVVFTSHIDNDGRTSAQFLKLDQLAEQQLCQKTYTSKDQVAINYQGGSSSSYLQKIDYAYFNNQALRTVNNANSNGTDLFGYRLNYHLTTQIVGQTNEPLAPRVNGDITSIRWAQDGFPFQYHNYHYDHLNRLEFDYTEDDKSNTAYTYDKRGNFLTLTRNSNGELIDDLAFNAVAGNGNQVATISDNGNTSLGYTKSSNLAYQYDTNGNMTSDPQKDFTVAYNHLDLPVVITFSDGRIIECLYDASGRMWSKILKDGDGNEIQRYNYIGSFQTINGLPYSVMHSEGRMVNEGLEGYLEYLYLDHQQSTTNVFEAQQIESQGNIIDNTTMYDASMDIVLGEAFQVNLGAEFDATIVNSHAYSEVWRYEWSIHDHIGNLRINYTGINRNNLTILQSQNYYPYGMARDKNLSTSLENKYQYNGAMEHVGDFGLNWEMTTFRSLQADIGRWGQVDPKAEAVKSLSPYSSMGNNPISKSDPDGDLFFITPHISFSGGLSIGVTAGVGLPFGLNASASGGYNFGSSKTFGSVGLNAGFNIGAFNLGASASYGSGGASIGGGISITEGNFGLGIGGASLSSSGFAFNGPSAGYSIALFGKESLNFDPGESDGSQQQELVDKELLDHDIDPLGIPEFKLESVYRLKPLPSIENLLNYFDNDVNVQLTDNRLSSYSKGVVNMSNNDFSSWRRLATAFGHELVHRVNNSHHWYSMRKNNLLTNDMGIPYAFNEALAHYWSYRYSGIGSGALTHFISKLGAAHHSSFKNYAIDPLDPK